nr:DUF222 domain-containing protein [Phytoactinopolyspora mesophila]
MAPGGELAAVLAAIPVQRVSGFDTVEVVKAAYRQANHDRAIFLRAVLETGLRQPHTPDTVARVQHPHEFAPEETRAALVFSRRRADTTFTLAYDVFSRLPMLGEAMLAGELDEPRAVAFCQWTVGLTGDQAAQICHDLLSVAPDMMVGELIDAIKRAAIAIDPDYAERRYRHAVQGRRFVGSRNADGTANVAGLDLPIDRAAAACHRVDTLARTCKRSGDTRPANHIRADIYLGMLDGSFQAMTDADIIAYVLSNPFSTPDAADDATNDSDTPGINHDNGDNGDSGDSGGNGDGPDPDGPENAGPAPTATGPAPTDTAPPPTDGGPDDDGDGPDPDGPDGAHPPPSDPSPAPTDTAPHPVDGGTSPPDTAPHPVDGGTSPPDTAPPPADGGTSPPDTAPPPADGGTSPTDTAPPPADGGTSPTDTAPPPADGGTSPTDTAPPPADGGTSRNDFPEAGRAGTGAYPVGELRIELASLLGLDQRPAELAGWDFIPAGLARQIITTMIGAEWRWVLCDDDGYPIASGIATARPQSPGRPPASPSPPASESPSPAPSPSPSPALPAAARGIVELQLRTSDIPRIAAAVCARETRYRRVVDDILTQIKTDTDFAETTSAGIEATSSSERRGPVSGVLGRVGASGSSGADARSDAGARRRTPGAGLRRWIQIRDRRCTFPACRIPARYTDQDHAIDYADGGLTTDANLGCCCRRHHRLKHVGGWVIIRPAPDTTVWVTPLGHTYTHRAPPVIFTTSGARPHPHHPNLFNANRLGCGCVSYCGCGATLPMPPTTTENGTPAREPAQPSGRGSEDDDAPPF